jgi:hypothetical protein
MELLHAWFAPNVPKAQKSFQTNLMVLLSDEAQLEARFGIVLIFTQDRFTVCVKRTIGLEIILDAPVGTPRLRGSTGSSFHSVWR